MTNKPALIRMDKETRRKADEQAAKLGLNLSEYVRLIISIDAATDIVASLSDKYCGCGCKTPRLKIKEGD